jgi:aldehyde dehydrogenase (NAD+)
MNQMAMPSFVQGAKKLLIGGQWVESSSGQHIQAINPATGELLCHIAQGNAHDVDRAVAAARKAFEGPWSRFTPHERRKLLLRVHDAIMDNFEELAIIETLDMGAPLSRTRSYKEWLSQLIQFYASQTGVAGSAVAVPMSIAPNFMALKHQAPVGVVAGIIPWNGPLMGLWWVYGGALATGCTSVLKPAEDASLSSLRVSELLMEAGVPDGVINVVTGHGKDVGQALAEHMDVDRIAFTGSVGTAQAITRASANNVKRLQMELGGKSPDIVFADADLDKAVPGAGMGVFGNTGQVCVAGTRILVQRAIHDEFVTRLATFAKSIKIGNGLAPGVQVGPLISQRQLDRVMHYMDVGTKEAHLTTGGQRLGGDLAQGFFVEPTVFSNVHNDMTIAREEIFGPVASVIPFDTLEEALRLANDTPYGLAGGVWTQNLTTAHTVSQGIRAGTVWVNCYAVIDPAVGFGGTKMSGYGWKGGKEHVEGFLYPKATYFNLG